MWQRLRAIMLGAVLLSGVFTGVVMRPQDIEELLDAHNRTVIERTIHEEEDDQE